MTLEIKRITPKLGAEISGVDLASLDEEGVAQIKAAFAEHLVLVFRDQPLEREALKSFGRKFGSLQTHPAKTLLGNPGDPEIFTINITAQTHVANGEIWHTDLSCEPNPPLASALLIRQVPEGGGGDTLFANMQEAFAHLSEPVQALLRQLTAFHDGFKDLEAYGYEAKPGDEYPQASHPVVPIHADTGREVLFVNEAFTAHINELSKAESAALLNMLYRHIERDTRVHCRVAWEPNTLVMWDNRAVHHHAVWDYYPQTRRGERVTVAGVVPPTR